MGTMPQTQQWEYLEVSVDLDKKSWKDGIGRSRKLKKSGMSRALAELGQEGWELAGTLPVGNGDGKARLYFKRPLVVLDEPGGEPPAIVEPAEA
ncbi:MAG: hypothetical protein ACRDI2_07965 [Chloroflexota bacterium]